MRIFFLLLALMLLPVMAQSQILPNQKAPVKRLTIKEKTFTLAAVKNNISKKKNCYEMAVTVNFIEKPLNSNFKSGPELGYATALVKQESNYLRSNLLLLRSGHDFSGARGNNFEIILRPKSNGDFDPNQVKITWRFPDIGLKAFMLENVHIQTDSYGATLTGDAVVDGKKLLAVSIAIGEIRCML